MARPTLGLGLPAGSILRSATLFQRPSMLDSGGLPSDARRPSMLDSGGLPSDARRPSMLDSSGLLPPDARRDSFWRDSEALDSGADELPPHAGGQQPQPG